MSDLRAILDQAYVAAEGTETAQAYANRHGIKSEAILTVHDDETADAITAYLEPRIGGKTVVEIGAGIGLLALHMGLIAHRVYAIEAAPIWATSFLVTLYEKKPKNVSYIFGAADEFAGLIKADVAIFCSHSGIQDMRETARRFAPVVIDVYGEIIAKAPEQFDPLARALRTVA